MLNGMNRQLTRIVAPLLARRFRRELAWALLGLPPVLVCVVVLTVLVALGFGLSPLLFGLPLAVGALRAIRGAGSAHRRAARALLGVRVADPPPVELKPGLGNWAKARLGDGVAWRAFGHLWLRVPLAALNTLAVGYLLVFGLGCLLYPLYWGWTDERLIPPTGVRTHWIGTVPFGLLGVLLLAVTPWIVHGLTSVDRALVVNMLGPKTLSERVRDLEQSRDNAIDDATTRLRRIERDLHDGAQAQLVALAMKLGLAQEVLSDDALDKELLGKLVNGAQSDAKLALAELRDLARGIRPPALDAGLEVALTTLAARSAIDVRLRVDLPERPAPAMETLLYFSAAELLTNAVKHAGAPAVDLAVTASKGTLSLTVSDEGVGGACLSPGGGLAGVAERVGTVDGRLDLDSPPGGPTVITARIPVGG